MPRCWLSFNRPSLSGLQHWQGDACDFCTAMIKSCEAAPAYIGIDLEWSDPQSLSQSFWMLTSRPDSAKVPEIWHFRPVSIIQIATLSPWMNWLKDGLVMPSWSLVSSWLHYRHHLDSTYCTNVWDMRLVTSTDMQRLMQYTPMWMKISTASRFKNSFAWLWQYFLQWVLQHWILSKGLRGNNWTQKTQHSLPATGACSEVWHCILDTKVLAGKTNWLRVTLLRLNSTT